MTSQPIRDQAEDHLITPKNAALLIIDYQPPQVSSIVSLDHRTSLAEKACAFLQATESNRTIKSHSSHAAICVDIAAKVYANTSTETNKNSKECLS